MGEASFKSTTTTMIPEIFSLGPIPVNSFGLMVALAIFSASILLAKSFQVNGLNPNLAEKYVLTGGIGGLIGARLWYVFVDNYDDLKNDLFSALISSAGFTFYGGFIISALLLFVLIIIDKIRISSFVDALGPALALGYAIGRLGCQLSGDGDYGIETTNIFGMSFSTGVIPTAPGVLVYPTPLYESTICILIVFLLLYVERLVKWQMAPGARFGLYLSLIAMERFVVEFIRINPEVVGTLSQAQVISLAIFSFGLVLIATGFVRKLLRKSAITT